MHYLFILAQKSFTYHLPVSHYARFQTMHSCVHAASTLQSNQTENKMAFFQPSCHMALFSNIQYIC